MKKLKVSFGEGGFQGWMIRHVEKFVLVLFAGVMVWFVASGSRLEGIKSGQTPDALKNEAQRAVTVVNTPRWEVVKEQPERKVPSGVEKIAVKIITARANPDKYRLDKSLDPPLAAKLKNRTDPKILAPFSLKVVPIYGPMALVPDESDVDPLETVVAEEEDPKKPKKPAPKKPPKKPAGGLGGMPGMPGGMPGMPGGSGSGSDKQKKKGKAGSDPPGGMPGMPGMPGMGGEGGMGGEMPGMGGMGGMGGIGGGKPMDSMIIGWRPPTGATIRIAGANVVMAVVPFEKQTEEFDANLANSVDYDVARDKPHYRYFAIQRVDVTDDPAGDATALPPEAWKSLNVGASLDSMQTWAGTPNDIMDPAYLMPLYTPAAYGLTQPLPPFVQRDLYEAMTHPEIPLAAVAAAAPELPGARRPKTGSGDESENPDEIPSGGSTGTKSGSGGIPGMPSGGGAGSMPGMPSGGGMPGMPSGGGMPGMPSGGGVGGMPGMPSGGGMPGMPSGGGMPGAYGTTAEKLVKYKLVRFVDQTVEAGRKYRYRIKVFVEDPNYPSENYAAPNLGGLDPTVQARVRDLEAKDAKSGKKTTFMQSPYSAASDVVTLPPAEWFYAGKVEPESMGPLGDGKKYPNFTRPYSGTSLVVVQDEKKAVDVPAKWEIYKGSAINFTLPVPGQTTSTEGGEVVVIHPALGEKRKIDKYTFQTNAVVADMRGGEDIPLVTGAHTTALNAPGEIMFVDSAGNMHVRDEVDDIEYFHRFIEQEPADPKKKKEDKGGGFDGFMGGLPGMPGMPGDSGAPGGIPGSPPGGKPKR